MDKNFFKLSDPTRKLRTHLLNIFAPLVNKNDPLHADKAAITALATELERLARLSPHLLEDVGMTRVRETDTSLGNIELECGGVTFARVTNNTCHLRLMTTNVSHWSLF